MDYRLITCPACKEQTPDDSRYCDQCGAKLMYCPKCRDARKGKRCTQCGSPLVDFDALPDTSSQPASAPAAAPAAAPSPAPAAASTTPRSGQAGQATSGKPSANSSSANNSSANSTSNTSATRPSAAPYTSQQEIMDELARQFHRTQSSGSPANPQAADASSTIRPRQQTPPPSPGPSRMVMTDNPAMVVIFAHGAVIGRTQGNYLNVFSSLGYTSGRHAMIARTPQGSWTITDLCSTNGTLVDGKPIRPHVATPLAAGSIVEIGYKKFRVE